MGTSAADAPLVLGVDLGGTFIKAGLVRGETVLSTGKCLTGADEGAAAIVERVFELGCKLLEDQGSSELQGLGVAVPGPLRSDGKAAVDIVNIPCLNDVPLAERLGARFECPAVLENDANAAVLAEVEFGPAGGMAGVVLLTLGTGVGGAVVMGGQLLRPPNGGSCELGHTVVDPQGPRCSCGRNGCLETFASQRGLLAIGQKHCPELPLTLRTSGELLARAAAAGDESAQAAFREYAHWLGRGIADFLHIFGPNLVILAGGLANCFPSFSEALWKSIHDECHLPSIIEGLEVVPSSLSDDCGVLGAVAAHRYYSSTLTSS